MSADRKPGYDTLVFFWFAIVLWCLGSIVQLFNIQLLPAENLEAAASGLPLLVFMVVGCYLLAAIFSIVVLHKCIAMLIYLVHRKP